MEEIGSVELRLGVYPVAGEPAWNRKHPSLHSCVTRLVNEKRSEAINDVRVSLINIGEMHCLSLSRA